VGADDGGAVIGVVGVLRSKLAKRILSVASALFGLGATALTIRHFTTSGWPMHHANGWLVLLAGELFLIAYGVKAWGWHYLFAQGRRPRVLTLAAAGGAASVGGVALPGRFDEVIRIAVVRRCRGCKASLGAVGLSIVLLGLLDSAALTPLASVAAAVSAPSTAFQLGLAVVAAAGVAAAAVVLLLPRFAGHPRVARFRVAAWAREHAACPRAAATAWLLIAVSWALRGLGVFVLLSALSLGASLPLALAVLCASAAAAALPIAPAGQAMQAGAGAAVLAAAGVHVDEAIGFGLATQALAVAAGALVVIAMGTDHVGARLRVALAR
jgi:uncharacterized membrane protein YbhN (UPF0104 family)